MSEHTYCQKCGTPMLVEGELCAQCRENQEEEEEECGMIDQKHKGEAIYIVGGGASLKGFDFATLTGKIVIACNRAIEYVDAQYMVYMDDQFYDWHEDQVESFDGEIFTHSWNKYRNKVRFAKNLGALGLSDSFDDGLFHGGNAAYLALNLAYVMGADPIFLLGVDMCYHDGATHFHEGYDREDSVGEKRFIHMIKSFNYGSEILKERGVTVFNCSDISKLKCFPALPKGASL
jgi:hypothetical protein